MQFDSNSNCFWINKEKDLLVWRSEKDDKLNIRN